MKIEKLLTVGGLGLGAWWLYNNWSVLFGVPVTAAASAAAPTPTTTTAAPPATTTAAAPQVSLVDQLLAAAAGDPALVNGTMNQDQWDYYRNKIVPPALTPAQFGTAFPDSAKLALTAQQFVDQLKSVGLAAVPHWHGPPRRRAMTGAVRINYRRKVAIA